MICVLAHAALVRWQLVRLAYPENVLCQGSLDRQCAERVMVLVAVLAHATAAPASPVIRVP